MEGRPSCRMCLPLFLQYEQGNILDYDDCSKTQDAGLVEQVVKMVELVLLRRERGAGCRPILVE